MANRSSRGDVTVEEKHQVVQFLLQNQHGGKPDQGTMKKAAENFNIGRSTLGRIWAEAKPQVEKGEAVVFHNRRLGVKHKDKVVLDVDKVKQLSVLERSTIRKMAAKLGVSKTTLAKFIQNKELRPHTNAIKPKLSEANKLARLKFSLSQLIIEQAAQARIRYQCMYNHIHIDEKWFYMTKTSDRYYLLPDESEPYRAVQSKRFISKVMFMSVVARPLFEEDGSVKFDGKIGIFPFTVEQPAQRKSKNRAKGTLETKPINSVTKEVIKKCIINQVSQFLFFFKLSDSKQVLHHLAGSALQIIPAIKEKWPRDASKSIIIQQDNAKPHLNCNDKEFKEAANTDGFNMQLICQPPNSPDLNINDLGFFKAIQSLQDDKPCNTVDQLLANIHLAFDEQYAKTLNNVFLTLQTCYTEIMKVKGDNNYKIQHMNKERLIRLGILPETIDVEEGLVRECVEYLQLPENQIGESYNISSLFSALGYV